jgi:hypothetical protein
MHFWKPLASLWTLFNSIPTNTDTSIVLSPGTCCLAFKMTQPGRFPVPLPPYMVLEKEDDNYLWMILSRGQRGHRLDVWTLAMDTITRQETWIHLDTRDHTPWFGFPLPFCCWLPLPDELRVMDRQGNIHRVSPQHSIQGLPLCIGYFQEDRWAACRESRPSLSVYMPSETRWCMKPTSTFEKYALFNPYVLYD